MTGNADNQAGCDLSRNTFGDFLKLARFIGHEFTEGDLGQINDSRVDGRPSRVHSWITPSSVDPIIAE
jgi:hypothetical protein